MATVFHARLHGRFIEIKSNFTAKHGFLQLRMMGGGDFVLNNQILCWVSNLLTTRGYAKVSFGWGRDNISLLI